ncbi:MAG TPA: dihydrodipicolinate synthase family protein [Candidatus Baltobacteraceae bacterium]|jgi:4-hydroxy-tetrahydrodipicolinate synthase|nr:dihydrodipicolinate synthase family protein [Candidatus Baltobacteraceae bacterium]
MKGLEGVFAAVVTPFDQNLVPDAAAAIPYYQSLLARGCQGLNILGTTGEAMSVGLRARRAFMEAVAQELPAGRLMVGVGASALDDAAELSRTAIDAGFSWQLIIPPFYYRDVDDDGIVRYFDALFRRTPPRAQSVVLYNFPRMSGITFHADLVERLAREFPEAIAGVKDSSNSFELEEQILQRCPRLRVFPGTEALLQQARKHGLAGCISGSVCLWPELAAHVWASGDAGEAERLAELRGGLPASGLIGAVRSRIANERADSLWSRSVPPLG